MTARQPETVARVLPTPVDQAIRLLLLTCVLAGAGCFGTSHLYYSQASVQSQERVRVPTYAHNWVWGLVHGDDVVMGAACGQNGVATVDVEHTLGDWIWFIFSFGIYDRTTITFTCQ
jgi:hypothetical protein